MTSPRQTRTFAPDAAAIERLADAALAALPETFRALLGRAVLRVEEEADAATLGTFEMDSPYDLTGLYTGRPYGEESAWTSGELPPVIHLYRRALLLEWIETEVTLEALITHIIVHEVGHHFGLSDDDMHALEDAAE